MLAFSLIFTLSLTACNNGSTGSKPTPQPQPKPEPNPIAKVIYISDIPKSVFAGYTKYDDFEEAVSLMPVGTALDDPDLMTKVAAFGRSFNNEDWNDKKGKTIEDSTHEWLWLYNGNGDGERYTGTGTFDVYFAIADASDIDKLSAGDMSVVKGIYKAGSVEFKEQENTEAKWERFESVTP